MNSCVSWPVAPLRLEVRSIAVASEYKSSGAPADVVAPSGQTADSSADSTSAAGRLPGRPRPEAAEDSTARRLSGSAPSVGPAPISPWARPIVGEHARAHVVADPERTQTDSGDHRIYQWR